MAARAVVAHADCRELHLWGGNPPARRVLLWPFDRPVAADGRPRLRSVRLWAWAAAVGAAIAGEVDPLTPRARVRRGQNPALSTRARAGDGRRRAAGAARRRSRPREDDPGRLDRRGLARARARCADSRSPCRRASAGSGPPSCRQWFDIATNRCRRRWLRATVADIPADVSPWAAPGVYLGSVDFLKRADVAASLDAQVWDLLVVDEAHTADVADRAARRAGRRRRARAARRHDHRDAVLRRHRRLRVDGRPRRRAGEPPPLMFRRSREDVGDPRRRRHRFAAVRITQGGGPAPAAARALQRAGLARRAGGRRRCAAGGHDSPQAGAVVTRRRGAIAQAAPRAPADAARTRPSRVSSRCSMKTMTRTTSRRRLRLRRPGWPTRRSSSAG